MCFLFIRKEEFNEVKIIPSILVYILLSFGVSFILLFVNREVLNNNANAVQVIIDFSFILFLFYKLGINLTKIQNLINDYLRKINIKEIIDVVFTQIVISFGTTLLILGIICLININTANSLNNAGEDVFTNTIASFILTVISAPILEELFFRVVLFKRISKFFNVYIGMILSSLLFGVLHMELAIVGAVIFGFANCILYLKYRNILIPMTVHFLNNFLVSIPTFLSSDSAASSDVELLSQSDASAYLILGSIVFIIGMILFIRFIVKNRKYIESDAFDNKTYNFNKLL